MTKLKTKEFLYAAKEEITHLSKYKSKVEELNQEIESLKNQLNERDRPETFDLSNEDGDSELIYTNILVTTTILITISYHNDHHQ